ncbi:MAG: PHP domain-containing protein [Clostridia bacterium]|nr:PHP domain-containing protein [Clostridia bacterium]
MKKILLPEKSENVNYYRANLHCHTKISDGAKTPEQIKKDYMAHGYSVVAFTDHDAFVPHNDLTDENFVALNGFELDASEEKANEMHFNRVLHICLVALDPDRELDVCHHRSKYIWSEEARRMVKHDESLPDYERSYTPECINDMIKKGKDADFFVTYNHPVWSVESYPQYMSYKGMDAMEILNYGCVIEGFDEDNGHCYDDMLRGGERIYCIATDDNHNGYPDDSPYTDSYGGYVMIAADKLEYRTIAKALKNGDFYSSSGTFYHDGPEVLSLEYEDGVVTIKTSPARHISYMTQRRRCCCVEAEPDGFVTEAKFKVPHDDGWFRITVTDHAGFKAYTNAYFTDELEK